MRTPDNGGCPFGVPSKTAEREVPTPTKTQNTWPNKTNTQSTSISPCFFSCFSLSEKPTARDRALPPRLAPARPGALAGAALRPREAGGGHAPRGPAGAQGPGAGRGVNDEARKRSPRPLRRGVRTYPAGGLKPSLTSRSFLGA